MKKEELRIGNLVDRGVVYELRNTVARIHYNDRYSLIDYEDLKPIPLTEKLLLSFGGIMQVLEGKYIDNNSDLTFSIEDNDWDNPCLDVIMNGRYVTCVEYVHELQNIVKEITKEDLQFIP